MRSDGARYEELTALLLDGELDDAGAAELAGIMRDRPDLQRDLRHHLEMWELWSQEQARERSAEAFLAGFRTRLRAEAEGERFLASVHERLADADSQTTRASSPSAPFSTMRAMLLLLCRPTTLAWAACAVVVLSGALIWLLPHDTAQADVTTLQGEVVCRHCILGETHEHLPAVRVVDATGIRVYEISSCDPSIIRRIGNFCARPIPVTAVGETSQTDGHFKVRIERCWKSNPDDQPPTDAPPPPPPDGPVLFPF